MAENTVKNGQTCLERDGIEARHEQTVRSEYNKENPYGANHPNALGTDGDEKGKGSGHGGHTVTGLPSCGLKPKSYIDYSNFDSQHGGNLNDQRMRKESIVRSLYGPENSYGQDLVNTALNIQDGQAHLNY